MAPTLYDWAGGAEALDRLTQAFYHRVHDDPILSPVFAGMSPDHPHHVALWLGTDSGVTHLAAAVGAHTVALFTEANLAWRPWAPQARTLVVNVEALSRRDIEGVVAEVSYLGGLTVYKVKLDSGAMMRSSMANTARLDIDAYSAGQRVVAWFTPDDCVVLEQ